MIIATTHPNQIVFGNPAGTLARPNVMQPVQMLTPAQSQYLRETWPMVDAYRPRQDQDLGLAQRLCLKAIAWYQRRTHYVDKDGIHRNRLGTRCPIYPHCSAYTADAIREYGVIKGIFMGCYRIFIQEPWFVINYALKNRKAPENAMVYDPVKPKLSIAC